MIYFNLFIKETFQWFVEKSPTIGSYLLTLQNGCYTAYDNLKESIVLVILHDLELPKIENNLDLLIGFM